MLEKSEEVENSGHGPLAVLNSHRTEKEDGDEIGEGEEGGRRVEEREGKRENVPHY